VEVRHASCHGIDLAKVTDDPRRADHISGVSELVREGYNYLATNWTPGDEIFIFGFSRGAFTARSIAGLIGEIGLLTTTGLPYLAEIYKDVQHQHDANYKPKYPDLPFPDKPSVQDPAYKSELRRRGLTVLNIPIKVIGVFDTVGSLGVPKVGLLTRLGIQSEAMKELRFYDTSLSNCIEYAFQALALDERRFAFQPTLWEKFPDNRTVLRQCWFPGAHANIGGGYEEQQMATITLAWMIAQCGDMLDFDPDYIHDQWDLVEDYYEDRQQKPRPWSFGKIYDGLEGIYAFGGSKIRTPGRYTATDVRNGNPTDEPLTDTCEYIHASARARFKLHGPGLGDKGEYECAALQDWKLVVEAPPEGSRRPVIFWKSRNPIPGFAKTLPEAPLWQAELELLKYDGETEQDVLRPPLSRQRRVSRREPRRQRSRQRSRQTSRQRSPFGDGRDPDR
jgi:hypothetical protein